MNKSRSLWINFMTDWQNFASWWFHLTLYNIYMVECLYWRTSLSVDLIPLFRLAIKLRCEKLKELCIKKLDTPLFCTLMDSGDMWTLEPELVKALLAADDLCIEESDVSNQYFDRESQYCSSFSKLLDKTDISVQFSKMNTSGNRVRSNICSVHIM